MLKLCIWMNIPSHYQSAFFDALNRRCDVDLEVRYFRSGSMERISEGWDSCLNFKEYEGVVESGDDIYEILNSVPEWRTRIHVISGGFNSKIITYLCKERVKWCHWSEMHGIQLAKGLLYWMSLWRLLNSVYLMFKRKPAKLIVNHAIKAFGQGVLARRSFLGMGVCNEMIDDLFYSPSHVSFGEPCKDIISFASGRKVFLSVSTLCKRKGIDVLLRAFSSLKTDNWCLIICGLDRSKGRYQSLANRLGLRGKVLFIGVYPSNKIGEVYSASDVFILPSRFDGWGAVVNEAASVGMPLIGTDLCGSAWHVIEPGINGFRVKAGSIRSLELAMNSYIYDENLCIKHGEASMELFFRKFTPDKNAERLVRALNGAS